MSDTEVDSGYTVNRTSLIDDCTFEVVINDVKAIGASGKTRFGK